MVEFTIVVAQTSTVSMPILTKQVKCILTSPASYSESEIYAIGQILGTGGFQFFKSAYKFDFTGLPAGAILISCKIAANVTQMDYGKSRAIVKLLDDSEITNDYHNTYDKVKDGSDIFHFDYDSAGVYDITSFVSSRLSQGYINIGAEAEFDFSLTYAAGFVISLTWEYYPRYNFTAQNTMEGYNGGYIGVGVNASSERVQSPKSFTAYQNETINIQAYDDNPQYNYYNWIFNDSEASLNKSEINKLGGSRNLALGYNSSTTYTIENNDNNASIVAHLKKICNLEFNSAGGYVYINNYLYSSPKTANIVAENTITASGQSYSSDGIEYTFNHWTDGSQSYTSIITASAHKTYTAVYTGKPSNSGENIGFPSGIGQPIQITWIDNPNTYVTQYQIWRRVKHNGIMGPQTFLETVNSGVQSYTDYEYLKTDGYTDDFLSYDVRAYYEPDGTYSDPSYYVVYGMENYSILEDKQIVSLFNEIPADYSITNYPNPFNPTTTINYQLPENGFVTLRVYDLLGKEVATLVNENKSAGYYKVNFDASKLTSGVYIYTINAGNYIQSRKMLLTK